MCKKNVGKSFMGTSTTIYPSRDKPLVSVILPTYNRAKTLPSAIKSVLNQSYSNIELIIVDDASDDETEELISGIHDSRVRYLRHEKQKGCSAARNTGIKISHGSFIAFQDSDDEWVSSKLDKQIELFKNEPNVSVVYCSYNRISATIHETVPSKYKDGMKGNILSRSLFSWWIGTPTMIIKRRALEKVGLFNESIRAMEDWEFVIRLAQHCQFSFVPEPLLNAYVTDESISSDEEAMLQSIEHIVNLHEDLYDLYPKAKASQWVFIGNKRCLLGEMSTGRKYFKKAIKLNSLTGAGWFGFFVSFLGQDFYQRIISLKKNIKL